LFYPTVTGANERANFGPHPLQLRGLLPLSFALLSPR
jgi:hypothetical protein